MTKPRKKNIKISLESLKGDFISEKSADTIIGDLKKARNFTIDMILICKQSS
ncbi:MAG: hypothetical protein JWR02_911 [Mucilaginibacter sp.]|nr:hypothetical protein [Mucilaginibacter sp.]